MRLSKLIIGVNFIGVINSQPVVIFPNDKLMIGSITFPIEQGDDFLIEGNVLVNHKGSKAYIYKGGVFVPYTSRYKYFCFLSEEEVLSNEHRDGLSRLSIVENGSEYLIDINETNLTDSFYITQKKENSVIFMSHNSLSLLFYTKTGQRLWEYREEDENLKINGRCIPVVDDVVVVITQDCGVPEKIQGFNIQTGEKLWVLYLSERGCPNTFFCGEDNMLYGCVPCYKELLLFRLDPYTGSLESWNLLSDEDLDVMPWNVSMHGRQLYYTDNRRGNEIGVIDVDKRELIERVPLNIKKKVSIGAPVVTDDKVYVFISDLQELRVFEK